MLIDTHSHVNFNAYKNDADEVVRRALDNDVWIINVGSQYATSKRATEMAEKYPVGVYAAIGLHPIHSQEEEFNYEKYKEFAKSKKVVAIGEIGLDYKYDNDQKCKEKQKKVLIQQIELAKELNQPVIFHCRSAHNDMIEILEKYKGIKGVIHCFTGTWQEAQKYLEMGFYLGFNGIIFKFNVDETIEKIPLDKILFETDCPYLTPKPMAGRNEPIYVKYVAEKIAKVRERDYKEIAEITTKNAKKLFKI